uniref:Uncharacterized protein n=1 Tax=Aotus nancymaae TaxID=37293 RepID=A0A2K5EN75_AOTNA
MRPPCGLWLWLFLLKVLQSQTPIPPRRNQVQGEVAERAWGCFPESQDRPCSRAGPRPPAEDDPVQTRLGQRCGTWSYVLIPAAQPGLFTVDHGGGEDGAPAHRDVTSVSPQSLGRTERRPGCLGVLRISLLGRSRFLPPGTLDQFICLGRAQGLSDGNIVFPDVTGKGLTRRQAGQWAPGLPE